MESVPTLVVSIRIAVQYHTSQHNFISFGKSMFTVSIITSMQMLFTAQPSIFLSFLLIQLLVLPGINHSFSLSLLNFFDSFLESTVRSPHIFLQLYTCLSTQLYTW